MRRQRAVDTPVEKLTTVEIRPIAGPETAARLGIAVGETFGDVQTVSSRKRITQREADRIRRLFGERGKD